MDRQVLGSRRSPVGFATTARSPSSWTSTNYGCSSAACDEIVLTGHPERVATQFRQRRAERTLAGESDVSSNIPDDRVDEVIAWATTELTALAAARPHATVISTDGDVDSTYMRVRDVLQRRSG